MAITLVVETGAVVSGSNTFVTEAEQRDWLLNSTLYTDLAEDLDQASLLRYMVRATEIMTRWGIWYGSLVETTQSLSFPRSGLIDRNRNSVDHTTVPTDVKSAQKEMVGAMLRVAARSVGIDGEIYDPVDVLEREDKIDQQTSRVKVVDNPLDRTDPLRGAVPPDVQALFAPFGYIELGQHSVGIIQG